MVTPDALKIVNDVIGAALFGTENAKSIADDSINVTEESVQFEASIVFHAGSLRS